MSLLKNRAKATQEKYQRRKIKVNKKIKVSNPEYRLILNKSNLYISAQLLDHEANILFSVSDKWAKWATKTQRAKAAGLAFSKDVLKKKIKKITIDRNGYSYQGRIHSFVEGLREWGIVC